MRIRETTMTVAVLLMSAATGCSDEYEQKIESEPAEKAAVAAMSPESDGMTDNVLSRFDLDGEEPDRLPLTAGLEELSGLATTGDGRLFGHNDERGVIYQLDPLTGEAIKTFSVGPITLSEDLEGLAIVGKRFYLVNSKGDIFEFPEGGDNESVDFIQHKTKLTGKFDVEGLCYDPDGNALLLACKEDPGPGLDKSEHRAIYSFSLSSKEIAPSPRFVLPAEEIEDHIDVKKFQPSGIERDPDSGHFLILSGNDPAVIEIGRSGNIIGALALPVEVHAQPEGIAFGIDGALLIGNEGGWLVRYASSRR